MSRRPKPRTVSRADWEQSRGRARGMLRTSNGGRFVLVDEGHHDLRLVCNGCGRPGSPFIVGQEVDEVAAVAWARAHPCQGEQLTLL